VAGEAKRNCGAETDMLELPGQQGERLRFPVRRIS
jgi:hypothetical protein